jgi:hypothetical protein
MATFAELTRSCALSLPAGIAAAPAAARTPALQGAAARDLVIVDGWILRANDLEKAAPHAA